jgi:hypothetical protein
VSTHDWVVVLITAAISVPISLIAPFGSDQIKERVAGRNRQNAQRRSDEIVAELDMITKYKEEPQKLHPYLLARLLYVTLLTIGLQILDGIASIGINIQYGIGVDALGDLGMRAYRIYTKVHSYDSYKNSMDQELGRLKSIAGK